MIDFIFIYVYVSEVALRSEEASNFPGAGITGCLMWVLGTKLSLPQEQ